MWSAYLLTLAVVAGQVDLGRASFLRFSNSSGCVDEAGFKECVDRAWDTRIDCSVNCNTSEDEDCLSACDCLEAQDEINCGATHCWNEVYSCAYQESVSQLLYTCTDDIDMSQIPFFPTPENAPGGCACEVSEVARKQRLIGFSVDACESNAANIDHLTTETELHEYLRVCQCCTMSALISSIWDTCPNTDPYTNTFGHWNRTLFSPFEWDACGPYLEEYDCVDTLGLGTEAAGGTENFYSPDNVPRNGTGILTTTDGTGTISTPLSGSTFTWTLGSSTYPITAAASNTAAATTDASQTTGQGAQETGGESAGSLQSRPSNLVAVAVLGVCIGLVGL